MISQAFETLSQAFEIPDWDFETLSQSCDGLRENLAESLYYNASHAVPITTVVLQDIVVKQSSYKLSLYI